MHTLILLSGKQETGKTRLCRLLRNAVEIEEADNKLIHVLIKEIENESHFYETVVVTTQETGKIYLNNLEKPLKEFTEKHKLNFLKYVL